MNEITITEEEFKEITADIKRELTLKFDDVTSAVMFFKSVNVFLGELQVALFKDKNERI